jgi:hypothetical protein
MKRCLPDLEERRMDNFEMAAHGLTSGANDLEVRHRARRAPGWIKRRIDAARERRGLTPLWGDLGAARRRAAKVKALRAFIDAARLRLTLK